MDTSKFIPISIELEKSGLIWHPEIGDEVVQRKNIEKLSILVDPQGLSPKELRESFVWCPTVEQLVQQLEARQAFLYHAGVTKNLAYEAVVKTATGIVEATAATLREVFGIALSNVLRSATNECVH